MLIANTKAVHLPLYFSLSGISTCEVCLPQNILSEMFPKRYLLSQIEVFKQK